MAEKGNKNALKVGTVLRNGEFHYTIKEVLGMGGFGITYRATGRVGKIDVDFAVKEFFMSSLCERKGEAMSYSTPVKGGVEAGKKSFIAESKRLNAQRIEHPNLVSIKEAFERSERIDSLVYREYNYWLEKGDSEKARKEQLACYENAYKLKETTQLKNKIASMKKRIK